MNAVERGRTDTLEQHYEGTMGSLRSVRTDITNWLADFDAGIEACERATLLVSELASNAVEATPGEPFELRARWLDERVVEVTVRNHAELDPPPRDKWGPAEPLAPRGRGLAIVDALSESVVVERHDGDIVVSARFRVFDG